MDEKIHLNCKKESDKMVGVATPWSRSCLREIDDVEGISLKIGLYYSNVVMKCGSILADPYIK